MDYTATKWNSVEDKAKFETQFKRFVLRGFRETMFNKKFYERLSLMFGHIAHTSKIGFYDTWFKNTTQRLAFLKHTVNGCMVGMGDPKWTWSDVEKVLSRWIMESRLIPECEAKLTKETETVERAQLARLKNKYGEV